MDSEVVVGPRFNKLCQAIDAAIINAGRQVPCKDFVSGFDFATEAKYEKLLGGAYLAMQSNLLANTKQEVISLCAELGVAEKLNKADSHGIEKKIFGDLGTQVEVITPTMQINKILIDNKKEEIKWLEQSIAAIGEEEIILEQQIKEYENLLSSSCEYLQNRLNVLQHAVGKLGVLESDMDFEESEIASGQVL